MIQYYFDKVCIIYDILIFIESESSIFTLTENTLSSSILSILELETPYCIIEVCNVY